MKTDKFTITGIQNKLVVTRLVVILGGLLKMVNVFQNLGENQFSTLCLFRIKDAENL